MPVNKNAMLRYKALDQCFSNQYRKFYIEDLMAVCAEALSSFYMKEMTVSRRQIMSDISFMKSLDGYDAPIVSFKSDKRVYYRYEDTQFNISSKALNKEELDQLKGSLEVLNRIDGLPGFDWIHNTIAQLRSGLGLDKPAGKIIRFSDNIYLKGLEYLTLLYQYIQNQIALDVTYLSFKMRESQVYRISPQYLYQFNNRWFLFGQNHSLEKIQNIALDRIVNVVPADAPYQKAVINYEEYFDDIIGVTIEDNALIEEVVLKFSSNILPYIISKPLHGSQKLKNDMICLNVKVNKELESLILSYGSGVRVISPAHLKTTIKDSLNAALNLY